MNFFKYYLYKKFLHNRKQPWIVLAILTATAIGVCVYRPTYRWIAETVNNNILLFTAICALLFLNMLTARVFHISRIREGHIESRGCAGSSCLLTVILAVCLTVLVVKGCRHGSTTSHQESIPYQILKHQSKGVVK